jgi:hypothetical protein
MGKVNDVVSNLVQMLEARRKEKESQVEIMDEIQTYLGDRSKTVVEVGLNRLLNRINAEAVEITGGTPVVIVSLTGKATLKKTRTNKEIDSYLRRLQSQNFRVLTLPEFSHVIESFKSQVAKGNLIPVIRFLMANTRPRPTRIYSPAPVPKTSLPSEPSPLPIAEESLNRQTSPSKWNVSDFLPASFPNPPLPRGFFKD